MSNRPGDHVMCEPLRRAVPMRAKPVVAARMPTSKIGELFVPVAGSCPEGPTVVVDDSVVEGGPGVVVGGGICAAPPHAAGLANVMVVVDGAWPAAAAALRHAEPCVEPKTDPYGVAALSNEALGVDGELLLVANTALGNPVAAMLNVPVLLGLAPATVHDPWTVPATSATPGAATTPNPVSTAMLAHCHQRDRGPRRRAPLWFASESSAEIGWMIHQLLWGPLGGVVVGAAVVGEALFAGSLESVDALLADVFASCVVFFVGGDRVDKVLIEHRPIEDDLDLRRGRFDRHEGVDPTTRHVIDHREHHPFCSGEVGDVPC